MTAITLGQAATLALGGLRAAGGTRVSARGDARRHITGAPVRRDSIEAGTFEEMFFAVPARGECDRLLRIARVMLDAGRKLKRAARAEGRVLTRSERLVAGLGAGAVRIYEELLTLARLNRGRVYPSYDRLAERTGLGRATVARGLAQLEAIGLLIRQRRFRRVEGAGPGPRYAQTSNVYRPTPPGSLPARILAHLPRWMQPAPLPDDEVQREADRQDETQAMLATLSCRDLARATVGGPLGRMLARLGAVIDRRSCESHADPQPLTNYINKDGSESA
ncbi:MAG: helix-turn-helix domain-containing protein [Rhizorhabdus sp.]|jgi:predicted transcriptional regulator